MRDRCVREGARSRSAATPVAVLRSSVDCSDSATLRPRKKNLRIALCGEKLARSKPELTELVQLDPPAAHVYAISSV